MAKALEVLEKNYYKLMEKAKSLALLQSTASIVRWDMETKMPPKAIDLRSEQLALLSRIGHKMITDPQIGSLLEKIKGHSDYDQLDAFKSRNVYLMKKNYEEQTQLPEKLVAETARQRALTVDAWKKAKAAEDFSMFKPELESLVDLRKMAASILMKVKKTESPYDALIDIYEPQMTSKMIIKIFDDLREGLISLMEECQASPKQPDLSILKREIPIHMQCEISKSLAQFIEYDIESEKAGGRIDETEHPFTTGYYDDVRITTHYYKDKFAPALFSVLHEGGHALYDQNLNPEWMYQPVGEGCSLGFHESQSRFVENIVGRSREFWSYFLPKMRELTGGILSGIDLDTFVFAINRIEPSKIRVEADEVTYCLHVVIRFEIERDLMADKISVAELPEAWNHKYKEYLGVEVQTDTEGVMQDTHWASGLIGYFPTYALGNIYSGQLLSQMERDLPEWRDEIADGDFYDVKEWLIEKVHRHGNLYDPPDLIRKITGEKINVTHYLDYLGNKYSRLYGV